MRTTAILLVVLLILPICTKAQEPIASARVGCIMQEGYGSSAYAIIEAEAKTATYTGGVITHIVPGVVMSEKDWEGGDEFTGVTGFLMHKRTYGLFYASLGVGAYGLSVTNGDNKEYTAYRIDTGVEIGGFSVGLHCDWLDVRNGNDMLLPGLRLKIAGL